MKKLFLFCFVSIVTAADQSFAQTTPKEKITGLLENWHQAAARANYKDYFSLMANESVFIGTDPTENWNKQEFMEWSKPFFDRGKAWSFLTLERNIFLGEAEELAWFDELLDTQMGICRGSGVVVEENGEWKIKHYVLSIAIPNENVDAVTSLKAEFDNKLISELRSQ
ncbi:nuclear transport factor 2 family protein [Salinimicrobium sp. CDJ15-81-2]|nr:nuclear transport factor 2 family protein [Salinimicrobium nanhaiense]